jgi:transcriptional regulator with XRE-family HTH domain
VQERDHAVLIQKKFGANVRRARVARRLTQEKLSELADLNIRTLQRIEAGEFAVLLNTAVRLAEAMKCPWTELAPDMKHR